MERALCSATLVGSGGIGGIIGGTVFRAQDEPTYHPGILTCMIASALIIVITLALNWKFNRANRRVDKVESRSRGSKASSILIE